VLYAGGNHECEFCTEVYGYKRELLTKYGGQPGEGLRLRV
jgi:serine/threonine-protein phosphatase 5